MCHADKRDVYRKRVADVRKKRDALTPESQVRKALTDEVLNRTTVFIEQAEITDLLYAYRPPVFGLVARLETPALSELDADIDLVVQSSTPQKQKELTHFLEAGPKEKVGPWYGGLFDIWAKATALKSGKPIQLDSVLPSGRDHDIKLSLGGRDFHIENTVITQDDESREVWDRFLRDKRTDPDKVLIRPGAYCPLNAKGPSPYYDALRLYAKIYDKLAKDCNPSKTQLAENAPNILLISFAGPAVRVDSPSNGWVLDELFADQPKLCHASAPDGITDISLDAWIDFTTDELVRRGKMTVDFKCDNFSSIMAAPRRLAGVLLFDGSTFANSRVNYNAHEQCRVSHREIVELEDLFTRTVAYWS